MPNLVALSLMVSDKKIFKISKKKKSFVAIATRVFGGIKFFQKILKRNHGRNISVKFRQNPIRSFREDGRTHDRQWAMT